MQKLYDMHMHTRFSGDSEANPKDMIAAAKERGLAGLIFTDHLDWDYWHEPHLFDLDLQHYLPYLGSLAKSESTEDFSIGVGIELGLQEHLVDRHKELVTTRPFDFVIGSIHQVNKMDPYYDDFYEGRSIEDALTEYLECTLRNPELFHDIEFSDNDKKTYDSFLRDCDEGERFLLICDNCGEIVLDKLMIEQLRKRFPSIRPTVLVRGGEAMNDVTEEDAYYTGIDRVADIVSNGAAVTGTVYDLLPP
ncbi:MAG: DUF89 family protein, partial [Lachnospiraceae bacterium]|nr:DUF89 family protein [Lachnospiraceae bacterium]